MSELPKVETRVGQAVPGDTLLFGYSLNDELVGHESLAGLVALAVTGQRVEPRVARILDDFGAVVGAADPHIWPLKSARLAACFGGIMTGLTAYYLSFHRGSLGPATITAAAHLLVKIRKDLSPGETNMESLIDELLAAGSIPGFGVPFRPRDERLKGIDHCVKRHDLESGAYWQLLGRFSAVVFERTRVKLNVGGALAALLLDLGFQADNVGELVLGLGDYTAMANAIEGAAQAAPELQAVPAEWVRYEGPGPRRSPRYLGSC